MSYTTFAIPADARVRYPGPGFSDEVIESGSWFDIRGKVPPIPDDVTTKKTVIRSDRVKLTLTNSQHKIVNRWFEVYRIIYNHAVAYLRTRKVPATETFLRDAVKATYSVSMLKLIKDSKLPAHSVENAIYDVHKAYKSGFAKAAITRKPFTLGYKPLGCDAAIVITGSSFSKKENAFAIRAMGVVDTSEFIRGNKKDCRLKKTSLGYYLIVPRNKSTVKVGQNPSLQFGSRTHNFSNLL